MLHFISGVKRGDLDLWPWNSIESYDCYGQPVYEIRTLADAFRNITATNGKHGTTTTDPFVQIVQNFQQIADHCAVHNASVTFRQVQWTPDFYRKLVFAPFCLCTHACAVATLMDRLPPFVRGVFPHPSLAPPSWPHQRSCFLRSEVKRPSDWRRKREFNR